MKITVLQSRHESLRGLWRLHQGYQQHLPNIFSRNKPFDSEGNAKLVFCRYLWAMQITWTELGLSLFDVFWSVVLYYVFVMFCYVFVMFCYVFATFWLFFTIFAMFCYVLLSFVMFCYVFATDLCHNISNIWSTCILSEESTVRLPL